VLITTDLFEVHDSQEQEQELSFTSFETEGSNSTIGIETGASLSLLSRHDRGLATIIGIPSVCLL